MNNIIPHILTLDWKQREAYWWAVMEPLNPCRESLEAVNRAGRELDALPEWAAEIRQQIRDFSPCHYCFPFALEVLLEGVGICSPVPSFRGCRSVSDTRTREASRQMVVLQKWLKAEEPAASAAESSQTVNPREIVSILGKMSAEKERLVRRLIAILTRERKKSTTTQKCRIENLAVSEPRRAPSICDCVETNYGGGASSRIQLMDDNPICHFKYFPYVNLHLTAIGTDQRKFDVLSHRQIEREYKNRLKLIEHYIEAMIHWLDRTVLPRAIQTNGANREITRKVYSLLGEQTPVKGWLVSSIRVTLDAYARYFGSRAIPIWEMSDRVGGGPAVGDAPHTIRDERSPNDDRAGRNGGPPMPEPPADG